MSSSSGAIASDNTDHPGQTSHIPIAQLTPLLSAPASRSIKAVVTLTWPYSSATGSVAFLLSEPDFRLRRTRGQVRVQFSGSSAKAVSQAGIASGDEIVLSLDGVKFVHDVEASASTPGRGVEFELKFAERLVVEFNPEGSREIKKIDIDHPSPELEAIPARLPTPKSSLSPLQPTQVSTNEASSILADDEWSSPALIKRARTSYGSLYDSDYDPFAEEDGSMRGQRRKRTRLSSSWRYNSRSPTPESDDQIMEPLGMEESTSTNPATIMTDEACQTLALDEGTAAEALATFSQQPINTESSSYFVIHDAAPEELEGDREAVSAIQPIPSMIHTANGDELHQEAVEAENDPSSPRLHPTQSDSLTLVSPIIHSRLEPSELTTHQNQIEYDPNSSSEPAAEDSAMVNVTRGAEDLYNASPAHGGDDAPTDDFTEAQGPATASDADMPPFTGSYLPEDQYGHWQTANAQFSESDSPYVATEQLPEGQYYEQQSQEMQYDELSGYQAETQYPPLEEESQDNGPSDWSFQQREAGYPDLPPTYGSRENSLNPGPPRSIAISRSQSVESEQIGSTEDSDDEFPQLGQESPLDKEMDAEFDDEEESEEGEYPEDEYDADENGNPVLRPDEGSEVDNEEEGSELDDLHYDDEELEEESDDEDVEDAESYTKKPPSVIDLLSSDDEEEVAPSQAQFTRPPAVQASSGSHRNNDEMEYPSGDDVDEEDEEDRDDVSDEEGEENEEEEEDEEEEDDEEDREGGQEGEDGEEIEIEEVAEAAESIELEEDGEDESDPQILVLARSPSENDYPDTLLDERESKETHKPNGMEDASEAESEPLQTVETQSRQESHLVNALVEEAEVSEKEDEAIQDAMELDEQNSVGEIAVLDGVLTISKSQKPDPGDSFPFARQLSMDGANDDVEVSNLDFAQYRGSDVTVEDTDPFTEILEPQVPKQDNYQLPTPADTQLSGKLLSAEQSFNSIASELAPECDQSTTVAGIQSEVDIHEEVDAFETMAEAADEENMIEEQIHREIEVSQTAMVEEYTPADLDMADVVSVFPVEPFLPVSPVEESVEEVRVGAPLHEDTEQLEPIVEITQEETAISFQPPSILDSPLHGNNEEKPEVVEVTEEGTTMGIQSPSALDTLFQNQDPEMTSAKEEAPESILIEEPPEVIGLAEHVIEALSEQGGQGVFHDDTALNPTTLQQKEGPVGTVSDEHGLVADGPRRSARRPKPATNAVNQTENARPITPNRTIRSVETSSGLKNETSPMIVLDAQGTPEGHDASVELALAANDSPSKRDLQGSPMADVRLRLTRELRTELPQFTPLKKLRYSIGKKIDVLGVATTSPPEPQRAKSGPRHYSVVFNITDASIAPSGVAEVQVFRPYKDALPAIEVGDGILIRNFQVVSVQKGFALRSMQDEGSSWAVFKGDEEPEIRGPPVEYGDEEKGHVKSLKAWFAGLDYVSLAKISRANGDKVSGKGIGKA